MRKRAKIDGNQKEIVMALRAFGCTVQSLAAVGDGCPDLLVGYRRVNLLMEIKDPKQPQSKRYLTPAEAKFHGEWFGQVSTVETWQEALDMVRLKTRERA